MAEWALLEGSGCGTPGQRPVRWEEEVVDGVAAGAVGVVMAGAEAGAVGVVMVGAEAGAVLGAKVVVLGAERGGTRGPEGAP